MLVFSEEKRIKKFDGKVKYIIKERTQHSQ